MTSKILVAVDLTDPDTTREVLNVAVDQIRSTDAELIAVSVVPDIVAGLDYRYAIRGERGGSADYDIAAVVADCLDRLNQVVAEHVPDGMPVETVARHGTVYEQVLKVAEELNVKQIVIGARRPSGVGDFLLGSNAARVVRHAHCSVNVVRL